MSGYEVPDPIINSPYDEPGQFWNLGGEPPTASTPGRRPAGYYYRNPDEVETGREDEAIRRDAWVPLALVNEVRGRLAEWRELALRGEGGVSRTTFELLRHWRSETRKERLFFAQLEAAETIIFLTEARADFLQGIDVPLEDAGEGRSPFRRYACKMATGTGKTTVMAMLAAWSILNKVNNRSDARFSDVVLVVCPNVTIRNRLAELDPARGEASLYRTRDLVPASLMPEMARGRVLVTNWHVFEPQSPQVGGLSARVNRAGVPVRTRETIHIRVKTTTARGRRYLTLADYRRQVEAGMLTVLSEERDKDGNLERVQVESRRYVESDASIINRVLGREVGGKQNLLVFNDEAHHAYRIRQPERSESEDVEALGDEETTEAFYKEATVWIDGLDRINRLRGINFCVDLSATPYFLGRVGQDTNRTFPWVVSDFGLTDSIESGLVKIPQMVVRDPSGAEIPGYFNIWRWVLENLTAAERGGRRGAVSPEAVVRWAHTPIAMLGTQWEDTRREWQELKSDDPRPPVFILVCKNTRIARVIYEWLAEDRPPTGIPSAGLEGLLNKDGRINTIRVDSKVVQETDTGEAKSDESRWMRLTLDTVGKTTWPKDLQERDLYPDGFEELAKKLGRALHPPGRDVRCIVSVGMLTEGWDCLTVTHIVGLRPFMSQLLCEQVVGRGLRRSSYQVGDDGLMTEEVAKIFGVPFEVIPFKSPPPGPAPRARDRYHVHAVPSREAFAIHYPRVVGYRQAIRNHVKVDWGRVAPLVLDPLRIAPEVEMKAALPNNQGRPSLAGPGRIERVDLNPFRSGHRMQALAFDLAKDLTRDYGERSPGSAPAYVLFPQFVAITARYLEEKLDVRPGMDKRDVFLSPYYGFVLERLVEAVSPDADEGEAPELPVYEAGRGPGSTNEVDFWTTKRVYEVMRSHVNRVVADTGKWEQAAAYVLDSHNTVEAFVKNEGLGFAIPYLHSGEQHDYIPDFLVRLKGDPARMLILETKGYDLLAEVKRQAAERWVTAVNAEGSYGTWVFRMARDPTMVRGVLDSMAGEGD